MSVWLLMALAPVVGSFLACAAIRLAEGRSLWGRSACPACGHRLGPVELVPLLSWLAARGRCRSCNRPVSPFYPAMELAAVAVVAVAAALVPLSHLAAGCALGWTLLLLAAIDWRAQILPDVLTLALLAAGLALAADPVAAGLAAAAGWAAFALLAAAYRRWRGVDGLGGGDAKLLAAAGAWVGPDGLPWVVLLGAGGALAWVAAVALRSGGWERMRRLPFGPFLAAAAWAVWLAVYAG